MKFDEAINAILEGRIIHLNNSLLKKYRTKRKNNVYKIKEDATLWRTHNRPFKVKDVDLKKIIEIPINEYIVVPEGEVKRNKTFIYYDLVERPIGEDPNYDSKSSSIYAYGKGIPIDVEIGNSPVASYVNIASKQNQNFQNEYTDKEWKETYPEEK